MDTAISSYQDYTERIHKDMCKDLRDCDHDCRQPYEPCTFCWKVHEADDAAIEQLYKQCVEEGVI